MTRTNQKVYVTLRKMPAEPLKSPDLVFNARTSVDVEDRVSEVDIPLGS